MANAGWETRDGRADMTNFEMDLFDTRMHNTLDKDGEDDDDCCKHSIIKPACLPITILAFLLLMTFFIPLFNEDASENSRKYEKTGICTDECRFEIVESIPTGMTFDARTNFTHTSTFDAWMELLASAEKSLDITAVYWNLKDASTYETAWQGNQTFYKIMEAAKRGVSVRIAQNGDGFNTSSDAEYLQQLGLAEVRNVNFTRLFGSGILHTKMWVIDQKHVYIGSANMDWKSLTEVKELGVVIRNCTCIASDIGKIFTIYWRLGEKDAKIPMRWPINLRTNFNFRRPLEITYNGISARTFLSSAPPDFNPKGREYDLNAIVRIMDRATEYVRIAVMDYLPITSYMGEGHNHYWPDIDDAIRSAAFRGLSVQLLISHWPHTNLVMDTYLRSLLQINGALERGNIEVKIFTVPSNKQQEELEFARVNHNKYMVTESTAYVGTSNWVGDYFLTTAGVGLTVEIVENETLVRSFDAIFVRDWTSKYAEPLRLKTDAPAPPSSLDKKVVEPDEKMFV